MRVSGPVAPRLVKFEQRKREKMDMCDVTDGTMQDE